MHHDGPIDGIIRSMLKATIKHLMCLEYSTVAIQLESIKDFLQGPDNLFDILESSLPRIAAIRKNYSDAVILPSAAELPRPTGIPGVPIKDIGGRLAPLKKAVWLAKGIKHSLSRENKAHHEVPQADGSPSRGSTVPPWPPPTVGEWSSGNATWPRPKTFSSRPVPSTSNSKNASKCCGYNTGQPTLIW